MQKVHCVIRVVGLLVGTVAVAAVPNVIDYQGRLTDNSPQQNPVTPPEPEEEQAEAPSGLQGLDGAHTSFVNQLISRPEWTREELLDNLRDALEEMLEMNRDEAQR